MNIHADGRTYPVRTEANLLPTLAEIARAKSDTRRERRRIFRLTGIWIDEDGRIVHLNRKAGRAG